MHNTLYSVVYPSLLGAYLYDRLTEKSSHPPEKKREVNNQMNLFH